MRLTSRADLRSHKKQVPQMVTSSLTLAIIDQFIESDRKAGHTRWRADAATRDHFARMGEGSLGHGLHFIPVIPTDAMGYSATH